MILRDGLPQAEDVFDRGLEFGDGVFETIAVINARPRLLERHLARLALGCERLGIGGVDINACRTEIEQVATEKGVGVLKLIVTRGRGGTGYSSADCPPTRWLAAMPARERPSHFSAHGVQLHLCEQLLPSDPRLAGIKHLNRLSNVLARREWHDVDIAEGLMRTEDGSIVCGTMSNVFLVQHDTLITPAIVTAGVCGVVRAAILDACRVERIAVREQQVTLQDMANASEVFVTNALIGAWPVRGLAGYRWEPGPYVRRVQEWLCGW